MSKEMIISSNGHETHGGHPRGRSLTECSSSASAIAGVVGNVYKGRVSKVLPGMQSAFVDIGLERDGFLYVSDVVEALDEFERRGGPEGRRRGRDAGARARAGPGEAAGDGGQGARRGPARQDRGPAEGRAGCARAGGQGAARHQGRPAHLARHDGRALPGLHADRRSRRRLAQDRHRARNGRGCAASSGVPREHTSAAASSSARRPRTGPREDIVATSTTSTDLVEMRQRRRQQGPGGRLPRAEPRAKLLRDLLTEDYQTPSGSTSEQEYQRVLELIERIMPSLRRA
jgi:Ribonuclease G/E